MLKTSALLLALAAVLSGPVWADDDDVRIIQAEPSVSYHVIEGTRYVPSDRYVIERHERQVYPSTTVMLPDSTRYTIVQREHEHHWWHRMFHDDND